MSKSLKQEMRKEFSAILPSVLSAVQNTPVTRETTRSEELIFKKVNFRMAFSALLLIFGLAVAGGGGYTYSNPNTYLTINFSAANVASASTELSANMAADVTPDYLVTLGVNQFNYVVQYDCSNAAVGEDMSKSVGLTNTEVRTVIENLIDYATKHGYLDLENHLGSMEVNVITNYDTNLTRYESMFEQVTSPYNAKNVSFVATQPNDLSDIYGSYPTMNPGKAIAIQQILFYSDAYTLDELAKMSNCDLAHILIDLKSRRK